MGILFWYFWCVLLAELAALAFVEFAAEALLYQVVQAVAEGFEAHLVDDFVDEGVLQQELGLVERDATLAHVEQGGVVELPNGRTVRTLHVVGIDFEHGLGVHTSLLGSRQILIGHLRGGLLRTVLYQYTAGEGSNSLIIEHVFVEFVTHTMGCLMGNQRVVIDVLLFVSNHTTVALALGTLTRESKVELVARDTVV